MAEKERIKQFTEINGSQISGITLHKVLRGHTSRIGRMEWSPDGQYLASPSDDGTIRIWSLNSLQEYIKLESIYTKDTWLSHVYCVGWSPDGQKIASGSGDNVIRIWEVKTGKLLNTFEGHTALITNVRWSSDGKMLASTSDDRKIIVWSTAKNKLLRVLAKHDGWVTSAAWSPDGNLFASGSADTTIQVWDAQKWEHLLELNGHHGRVTNLIWSSNGKEIISASYDATIRVWDIETGQEKLILEGHGATVRSISFSFNGRILASNSWDETIRLWRCDNWEMIGVLRENVSDNWAANLTFNPKQPYLATLGDYDTRIYIWKINVDEILESHSVNLVRYTTAKIVLVGDSGVGKTGLGWRLAHNEFKEHSSTHGQQFWVVPELKKTREDGTECEAVLWDLAGQHIYRSIHSIFLDDVDASLVLFDPTNRQEPLKGAQFWLEQLKSKKQLPPSVLVGARLDRGSPVLSQQELDQFCQKYGISGGYIGTSAKSGEGLDKLVETLKGQIPWDQMTTTVTTVTFKRIKEFVLSLKERPDRKGVLVKLDELRSQLEAADKDWEFSDAEMMTAVGHLANHGYVTILKSSPGDEYILLVPELLASVASSIFLHADKHPRELGAINETDLLQGKYPIEEFKGLEKEEQQVLLDATVVRFLEHSLCFRETLGNDNLLIFPSLIKQKRPLKDDVDSVDDTSYIVHGRVENIYASLVVLLGYTTVFTRINQWQNQAQYEMSLGEICGFRLSEERESEIELVLYYSRSMPEYGRTLFQGLFEANLYKHEVDVSRFAPVRCKNKHLIERTAVIKRLRDGKNFIFCDECGERTLLPELEKPERLGDKDAKNVEIAEAIAKLRNIYETNLVRVKGFRRDRVAPRCYISHANDYLEWAAGLEHDLRDAGVVVLEDKAQVENEDFILQVCTPVYKQDWEKSAGRPGGDSNLVYAHLDNELPNVIPILREGDSTKSSPKEMIGHKFADFRFDTLYSVSLFDLVLSLYKIPLNHHAFEPLREVIADQWKQTFATVKIEIPEKSESQIQLIKVFISYSHKDESFKNDLVTMLSGNVRRGLIEIWHDRKIEEGDEWREQIMKAMKECDLALLFISKDFIASRFIQDVEIPNLLQRRKENGLRVVPIIISPCLWKSEPVLSDIQALPKDAEPISSFPEGYARDKVWEQIALTIEKRASEHKSNQE